MKHFPGKKQNFWSWVYSPQIPDYRNLWINGHWINGVLLYMTVIHDGDNIGFSLPARVVYLQKQTAQKH
jgi:hypothetical protein